MLLYNIVCVQKSYSQYFKLFKIKCFLNINLNLKKEHYKQSLFDFLKCFYDFIQCLFQKNLYFSDVSLLIL